MRLSIVLASMLVATSASAQASVEVPDAPDVYREADVGSAPEDARIRSEWPAPPRRRAFLRLVSDGALTVHLREGSRWTELCTTPCAAALLRGPIELAVSRDDGAPVAIERPVVERDGAWRLALEDRSRTRGSGVVLGIAAALLVPVAIGLFTATSDLNGDGDQTVERALLVGGGVLALTAGIALAISVAFVLDTPDEASATEVDE